MIGSIPVPEIARYHHEAWSGEGYPDGISGDAIPLPARIVGEAEGRALNHAYRQRDYATNVLTFDYDSGPVVMADLVLCAPVIAREAKELGKTLADHYAHLLVHGTLHAQGWDHETGAADARAMEAHETLILAGLGVADPYRPK